MEFLLFFQKSHAPLLPLPPLPPQCQAQGCLFFLSDAPLPTPQGWLHLLSSLQSLLARDNDDGSNVRHCSCCPDVVMLLLLLLTLLTLLTLLPGCQHCSRRHCHQRTAAIADTINSTQPPPLPPMPLPSQP